MAKFSDIKSAQLYCHEQNHYNILNTYISTKQIAVFRVFIITNAMGSFLKNLYITFPVIVRKENVNSFLFSLIHCQSYLEALLTISLTS